MGQYSVDRDSDTPLYIQIRDSIVEAIDSQELFPGDRLPPVSLLAKEIGVTQATIRRALQDLGKAGHTECHVGRGTFITDAKAPDKKISMERATTNESSPVRKNHSAQAASNPREFAARRLRSGVSKALYDIMPLAQKPGIIQFTMGVPDPDLLPDHFIEEITEDVLKEGSSKYIQATDALGMYELRQEIARRFSEDNAKITPDQVLITNGALQAVTLIGEAALESRPTIICETPCFQGIPDTFAAMGHWVETSQRDIQGPITEKLDKIPSNGSKLLYLCPYSHNPSGTDLSARRYDQLVDWAKKTESVIITDEIFKELHFEKTTQPSLLKDLGSEQTMVVSSLSKSIMTGLRLGWIISSPGRIRQLAELKRLMDHSCPTFIQGMGLSIFTSGKFDSHTTKMRSVYKERMETMVSSLMKLMPKGVKWSQPVGGFSMLLELPQGYSSVALLLSAIDKGVSFLPCPLFDIDQRYINALRLSSAWVDKHQIKEGIELLASAIEEFISHPPGDSGLSGLGNFQ